MKKELKAEWETFSKQSTMVIFNIVGVSQLANEIVSSLYVTDIRTSGVEASLFMSTLCISSGFKMLCSNKRCFNEV
jgi:hypothetical protein